MASLQSQTDIGSLETIIVPCLYGPTQKSQIEAQMQQSQHLTEHA